MTPLRNLARKPLLLRAVAVVVGAAVLAAVWPREPTYQDRPLSYWLDRLPETLVTSGPSALPISMLDGERLSVLSETRLRLPQQTYVYMRVHRTLTEPVLGTTSGDGQEFGYSAVYRVNKQTDPESAEAAIEALRSRSLPTLLRWLQMRDTLFGSLRENLSRVGVRCHFLKRVWHQSAERQRGRAVTALVILGSTSNSTLPEILRLARTDPDPGIRTSALEVLRRLSPADYVRVAAEHAEQDAAWR